VSIYVTVYDMSLDAPPPSGLIPSEWRVPKEVSLSDDGTTITCSTRPTKSKFEQPTPKWGRTVGTLSETAWRSFVTLDSDPAKTVRFAMRWGLLGLCHHRLPSTHRSWHRLENIRLATASRLTDGPSDRDEDDLRPDLHECTPMVEESLDDWWFWSRQAAALTSAATRLQVGRACSKEEIESIVDLLPMWNPNAVFGGPPGSEDPRYSDEAIRDEQQRHVARITQQWLELADVTVTVIWPAGTKQQKVTRPVLGYHGSGLFAALGITVAMKVTSSAGVYICDHCGKPYPRYRAPHPGKKGYCGDCKRAGAQASWRAKDPSRRAAEAAAAKRRRSKGADSDADAR
jgi:hypothetical protein